MFSLAANAAVLAALLAGQAAPLSAKEQTAWDRIRPSIVILLRSGNPTGAAAMIDDTGLFITHRSAFVGSLIEARTTDGRPLRLRLRAADGTTQLALLVISGAIPTGMKALLSPTGNSSPGRPLFAVLPSGPVRAEFVSGDQVGRFGAQLRVLPISEVRFESTPESIGGALLVSYNGEFLGTLNATLPRRADDLQTDSIITNNVAGRSVPPITMNQSFNRMGPAQMTVAYSIGPDAVRRVIDGFRGDDHEVDYPTLGVFCRDAVEGGALIMRIVPGSGAEQAKLRAGDVILGIGSSTIRNQIDFSKVMLEQRVGAMARIRFRRNGIQYLQDVSIGRQTNSSR